MYSKLIDNQPIDQPMSGAKMQSFDIDYDQCLNRLCIGLANNDDDDDNGNCIGSKSCRALMSGLFLFICFFHSIAIFQFTFDF